MDVFTYTHETDTPETFFEDKYTLPKNGFMKEDREHIQNIHQQLGPIRSGTHTSINIPVCGHQEDKTIFRALYTYVTQRWIHPEEFEINLLINSPEETGENMRQYSWDKTLDEIERFRKEHPSIQINVATLRLSKRQQDIGILRAYITDARVLGLAKPEEHIFISHDADTASLPPEYLLRIWNIFRNKSQVHLIGWSIRYSDELMCMFPAYALATIFRRLMGIRGIKTTGGNTAYRASSYIKSGWYQPTLGLWGEDRIIWEAIKKVYSHEPKNGYVRIGTPGVVVSDARRIIEQLLKNDWKSPPHGFWKNPPQWGKIQRKTFTPDESYREKQYPLQTEILEQHLSQWDVFLRDFSEQLFDEIKKIFQNEYDTLQRERKIDKNITLSNALGQKWEKYIPLSHIKRFQFACYAIGIENIEIGFSIDEKKQIVHPYIILNSADALKEKMRNFMESIREKIENS
jgi:hypothetical protein